MTVDLKIHPTVREFIICTNGSDLIVPKKGDWLWLLLKQHLTLSMDYHPIPADERSQYIRIQLLDASGAPVVNHSMPKNAKAIHLNPLFRNSLSERGQNVIANHLRSQFKECFHNFMSGAVASGAEHAASIELFCQTYHLTMNQISEDMLKKSWQRSPQKGSLMKVVKQFCPLIF